MSEQQHDLNELFARDPLSYTDDDIDTIVEALRAQRKKFAQEEEAAKAENRKPKHGKLDLKTLKLDL